jgi:predicted dehydrogenase
VCQLAHFCDVIEGKAVPLVSAVDGLQNLRIVEAISQAAQTGKPVSIAHDDQIVSVGSKEN